MKWYKQIAEDTLKRNGKYSRTSLTMATAWVAILAVFISDYIINGFNEMAFTEILAVAIGIKWVDAKSKQLENS